MEGKNCWRIQARKNYDFLNQAFEEIELKFCSSTLFHVTFSWSSNGKSGLRCSSRSKSYIYFRWFLVPDLPTASPKPILVIPKIIWLLFTLDTWLRICTSRIELLHVALSKTNKTEAVVFFPAGGFRARKHFLNLSTASPINFGLSRQTLLSLLGIISSHRFSLCYFVD